MLKKTVCLACSRRHTHKALAPLTIALVERSWDNHEFLCCPVPVAGHRMAFKKDPPPWWCPVPEKHVKKPGTRKAC